jgi:hypothetical protein
MAKKLELEVVGMGYRVTTATLEKIAADCPLSVKLVREPDNSADENAVMVVITEKPYAKPNEGFHVGYIMREAASVIAPAMDEGGKAWPYKEAWLMEVDPDTGRGQMVARKSAKPK